MADKYKFALIALVLVMVAVLAGLKVMGGEFVAGLLTAVVSYLTGQVAASKLGGGGAAKVLALFAFGLTMTACAGWQTQAKASGDQLQKCMVRAAQQCAIEAASQLVCPVPPPEAPAKK